MIIGVLVFMLYVSVTTVIRLRRMELTRLRCIVSIVLEIALFLVCLTYIELGVPGNLLIYHFNWLCGWYTNLWPLAVSISIPILMIIPWNKICRRVPDKLLRNLLICAILSVMIQQFQGIFGLSEDMSISQVFLALPVCLGFMIIHVGLILPTSVWYNSEEQVLGIRRSGVSSVEVVDLSAEDKEYLIAKRLTHCQRVYANFGIGLMFVGSFAFCIKTYMAEFHPMVPNMVAGFGMSLMMIMLIIAFVETRYIIRRPKSPAR